jgi:hypothetical protein
MAVSASYQLDDFVAFLVPFYLIGHGIVFVQARRQAVSESHRIEPARHPATLVSTV